MPEDSDGTKILLGSIRLIRGCMILAEMHSHFYHQMLLCVSREGMGGNIKEASVEQLEKMKEVDMGRVEQILGCLAGVIPA